MFGDDDEVSSALEAYEEKMLVTNKTFVPKVFLKPIDEDMEKIANRVNIKHATFSELKDFQHMLTSMRQAYGAQQTKGLNLIDFKILQITMLLKRKNAKENEIIPKKIDDDIIMDDDNDDDDNDDDDDDDDDNDDDDDDDELESDEVMRERWLRKIEQDNKFFQQKNVS
jgi:phosphopantothenoylcysteine synthetase/decarboxylase